MAQPILMEPKNLIRVNRDTSLIVTYSTYKKVLQISTNTTSIIINKRNLFFSLKESVKLTTELSFPCVIVRYKFKSHWLFKNCSSQSFLFFTRREILIVWLKIAGRIFPLRCCARLDLLRTYMASKLSS